MQISEFDKIVHDAHLFGVCVNQYQKETMFSCGETKNVTEYEFQGFLVGYEDGEFFTMQDKETGEEIKRENCTTHNLNGYSTAELEQIIKDAEKLLKLERNRKAQIAIDNFNKAWKELQRHSQVRMRVNGNKTHFHDNVNNVTIQIMPLN